MANPAAILAAVRAVVANPREAAAMLYACGAESNCESIQNLMGAPAYGPWQIYLPYHPGVTPQQADDPAFAAAYMYGHRDVKGCTDRQGDLWQTNPDRAAFQAARCIEGGTPAEPYGAAQQAQGRSWAAMASNASGGNSDIPPGYKGNYTLYRFCQALPAGVRGITSPCVAADAINNAANAVANSPPVQAFGAGLGFLDWLKNFLTAPDFPIRAAFVVGGFGLMFIGAMSLGFGGVKAASGGVTPVPVPI